MIKRKGRQHPYYWASFIQSGDWSSLDGEAVRPRIPAAHLIIISPSIHLLRQKRRRSLRQRPRTLTGIGSGRGQLGRRLHREPATR